MNIPYEVSQLLTIIEKYKPLLVGGCVRDTLIGKEPKDFDVVVENISDSLLKDISDSGWLLTLSMNGDTQIWNISKKFPMYQCIKYRENNINFISDFYHVNVELLSFRGKNLEEDSMNRDLTINSLYYDPFSDTIIDPTNKGLDDVNDKIIRFNNKSVVESDPLRILRAYRLSKQLGFKIEERSLRLCRSKFKDMIDNVNYTRIMNEIEKLCL